MRILFCNTTYMKYYEGRSTGDYKPVSGGSWIKEHEDEDPNEIWNFLNMDGYCYGFVQGNGKQIHIERFDKVLRQQDEADDTIVIWCAVHPTPGRGTLIVGWYEHATVYRYAQFMNRTPITGLDRAYLFKTKAEDAYLLPENERTFEIKRAALAGSGTGFGRENYWYADSEYAKDNIIPKVLDYIEKKRGQRINKLTKEFAKPENMKPLTEEEEKFFLSQEDEADIDTEYLSLAYRKYAQEKTADNAYCIAASLMSLYQFKMSLPWFEKTIELDPGDWGTRETLTYVYQQAGEYEKSTALAEFLLVNLEDGNDDKRDELYSVLADNYMFSGEIEKGISWLNRILKESHDKELIDHTKKVKEDWTEVLSNKNKK